MILNGYSGIAAFAALLRVALGLVLIVAAVRAFGGTRRAATTGDAEPRYYLRFVLGATLLALSVAAWPLFYLVLQSYVGLWPSVMCIDGVTRIGTDSANAAAYLPGLVAFLEISKPLLVFVAGAWLVLHLLLRARIDRRLALLSTATLLLFGLLGAVDGAAEGAYLLIPKQEQALATGCCTVGSQTAAFVPLNPAEAAHDAAHVPALAWLFLVLASAVVALLSAGIHRTRTAGSPGRWFWGAAAGAVALLPIGSAFLHEVGAPLFLRLPYHKCAYCLVGLAPESLVGIALFTTAIFAVGWAAVVRALDRSDGALAAPLLRWARFGLLATLLMVGVRMATA